MAEHTIQEFTMSEESMIVDESEIKAGEKASFDHSTLLPKILRALGALIIAACAAIFLFQKWGMGNDVQRYLYLLGLTSILTAGGFFCGLKLQESKGARTLLSLTVAIAPVNFTVLGGLLYSQFAFGAGADNLPSFASWVAPTPTSAVLTVGGAILILAALCYISFLTLGRSRARLLSLCFLISNLMLLVPTRDPDSIGLMLMVLVVGLVYTEIQMFRYEPTLKTLEGRLSRAALWVPALLLISRSGYLYYSSDIFYASVFAATALVGFLFLPTITRQAHVQKILQGLSMVPAVLAWFHIASLLFKSFALDYAWALPLCCLPTAALLAFVSFHAVGNGAGYRRTAAVIALSGVVVNLYLFPGLGASFVCLLTAITILIYGFVVEQKVVFFSGIIGVAVGLGYHLKYALTFYSLFNWGSLALTGVAIIITASLIERHQGLIGEKIKSLRGQMQNWSN